MFELLYSLPVHLLEVGAACLKGCRLVFECLACGFEFVACAGVFALLLVELQFALFDACLVLLYACHALIGGFFCLGGYLQGFLTTLKYLAALEVFGLTLGIGHYLFGASGRHAPLHHDGDGHTECGCHNAYRYI